MQYTVKAGKPRNGFLLIKKLFSCFPSKEVLQYICLIPPKCPQLLARGNGQLAGWIWKEVGSLHLRDLNFPAKITSWKVVQLCIYSWERLRKKIVKTFWEVWGQLDLLLLILLPHSFNIFNSQHLNICLSTGNRPEHIHSEIRTQNSWLYPYRLRIPYSTTLFMFT